MLVDLNSLSSYSWSNIFVLSRYEHRMEEAYYENSRVDAISMERLTAAPQIINIFGFCGLTVVTEFAGKTIKELIHFSNHTMAPPKKRFELALYIARGVQAIHSIAGDENTPAITPSLVHNDINLANLVVTEDDRPVLNDFNVAILLQRHNETGETCPFISRFPNPQWRSPEEQQLDPENDENPIVTEMTDIYGLGNIFFRLAIGRSPWKRPGGPPLPMEEIADEKFYYGTAPPVPIGIRRNRDPHLQKLLSVMDACFHRDPSQRPTASEVVELLSVVNVTATSPDRNQKIERENQRCTS